MHEVIPLMAGLIVGLMVQRLPTPKLRIAALVLLCTLFGAIASFINGELAISWVFLAFDITQVFLGAVVAPVLFALWKRRSV